MLKITSSNNPLIRSLISLQTKKERQLQQKFLVEGYHLCQEAQKRGLLSEILICDEKDEVPGIPNYLVTYEIIKKITKAVTPQPIAGVVRTINEFDFKHQSFLLLDDVSDPGNLGTIIRSAVAFGVEALIMSPDTVDIYNDKAIRATQGTLFDLPYAYMDLEDAIVRLKSENITIYGTSLKDSVDIRTLTLPDRWAVIMGNEARGVSSRILSRTDCNLIIPISPRIDSLNVSVSAGIIMYEFMKARS